MPVGQEMQAELKDKTNAEKVQPVLYFLILVFDSSFKSKVSELLGIDTEWMCQYFCKPKLKVRFLFNSAFIQYNFRSALSGWRKGTPARTPPTPWPVLPVPSTREPSGSSQRSVTRPLTVRFNKISRQYTFFQNAQIFQTPR